MVRQLKKLVEEVSQEMMPSREQTIREQLSMNLKEFADKVAAFNQLGEALYNGGNFAKLAEQLEEIANHAEAYTLQETDGAWFDQVTIKRNMKELKGYAGEFKKVAAEAHSLQERMTALYEDCGRVLGRYFEIKEMGQPDGGSVPKTASEQELQVNANPGLREAEKKPTTLKHPSTSKPPKPVPEDDMTDWSSDIKKGYTEQKEGPANDRTQACSTCGGKGRVASGSMSKTSEICPKCKGKGVETLSTFKGNPSPYKEARITESTIKRGDTVRIVGTAASHALRDKVGRVVGTSAFSAKVDVNGKTVWLPMHALEAVDERELAGVNECSECTKSVEECDKCDLRKEAKWIQKAVNPEHKGYCTPMSKSTCTPRRKALAQRFKKGIDNESVMPRLRDMIMEAMDTADNEHPIEDWTKLDVPMLKKEVADAFEKAMKKAGYTVRRHNLKERAAQQEEFAEFYVHLKDFDKANDFAVRTYPSLDLAARKEND